jgi:hypothetical protein
MLRASSSKQGRTVQLAGFLNAAIDVGVVAASQLMAATDAAVLFDAAEIDVARDNLVAAVGHAAAIRTFAVAGNFQMMNRLLDATGARVNPSLSPIADEIGVEIPAHLLP